MKSGPVDDLTTTRLSARMSRMLPMISGGLLSRSSSCFSRRISFWSRTSSVSAYRFSPSTRRAVSNNLSLRVATEHEAARHRPTAGGPPTASDAEGRVRAGWRIGADGGLPPNDPPSAGIPRMEAGGPRREDQRAGERDREARIGDDHAGGRPR